MSKVFVYGTLKRGFPLFGKGLSTAKFIGHCQTVHPYPMHIALDFYGPVMLDQPGLGLHVKGELFEVEDHHLPVLDELEDVGKPGSFRSMLEVVAPQGVIRGSAIGFMKDERWLEPLHTGHLSDYQDRRFIPPWQR